MDTIFLVLFLFTSISCAEKNNPFLSDLIMMDYPENNQVPLVDIDPMLDNELERLSDILLSVLKHSWGPSGVPIIYLEQEQDQEDDINNAENDSSSGGLKTLDTIAVADASGTTMKRSRYYRRYPWKRQNSRSRTRYEVDNRYMCQPTREDVFKLLVALHETRAGNAGKSIHFCNRRRSAGAIFTNIRFLGKK